CARAAHVTMPPHAPDGYTSTSDSFAIGVSFTGHVKAVIEDGCGHALERTFPAGTCGINGPVPVSWLSVAEPGEALEIYPSEEMRTALGEELHVDWHSRTEFLQAEYDPIVWSICARWRMAACGAAALMELEADELVHNLLAHVAVRYLGAPVPKRVRGRL